MINNHDWSIDDQSLNILIKVINSQLGFLINAINELGFHH